MPKVGMEPIRRSQVTEAVLGIIAAEGMDGVTLDKAAKSAGVSKGVVSYYFANKETLIQESCKAFLESYATGIRTLMDLGMENRLILRVVAYTVLGRGEEISTLDPAFFESCIADESHPVDESQSTSATKEQSTGFSLDSMGQQAVFMQLFSRMSHNTALKMLLKDVYTDYLHVIGSTIEEIIGDSTKKADSADSSAILLALQFMAMLDGLMFYNIMDFETDNALDAIEKFIISL